jgi:hypothetical protein
MDKSKAWSESKMVFRQRSWRRATLVVPADDLAADIVAMEAYCTEIASMPYTTKLTATSIEWLVLTPIVYKYTGAITMAARKGHLNWRP